MLIVVTAVQVPVFVPVIQADASIVPSIATCARTGGKCSIGAIIFVLCQADIDYGATLCIVPGRRIGYQFNLLYTIGRHAAQHLLQRFATQVGGPSIDEHCNRFSPELQGIVFFCYARRSCQ